jgi:RimJ/RimL family protein N-acetyltransferase
LADFGPITVRVPGPGAAASCTLRAARPDDAPVVLAYAHEIFATCAYLLTSAGEFTLTPEEEREIIADVLAHPRQVMMIAVEEGTGRVVGMLSLRQNTAKRKLRHCVQLGMTIRDGWRGRGLGKAMMRSAIDWARANPDIEQIILEVYAVNEPGLRLYRGCGFVEHGRIPGGLIHDDGTRWDQVLMHLEV